MRNTHTVQILSPHIYNVIFSHTVHYFLMQIGTISVQCFEICNRLQYTSLCSCLCCVRPGALTLLDILKSRRSISFSSHHLKGNECHFIEIGSLSLHWSNIISDVYVLFGAAFSFSHFENALHWSLFTLMSLNAKILLMLRIIFCTCKLQVWCTHFILCIQVSYICKFVS